MRQKSKSTPVSSEGVVRVRDIRRATRKHHGAEEKIRIAPRTRNCLTLQSMGDSGMENGLWH